MKPEDILPDNVNSVAVGGVDVRKGSVAAVIANALVITDPAATPEAVHTAETHLVALLPSLRALRFFEVFDARDERIRALIERT